MKLPVRAPGFWWTRPAVRDRVLAPVGAAYGAITARKMARPPDYYSHLPVICVGNFVAGGAGKTPVALALAALVRAAGRQPGFLSRGYGGDFAAAMAVDADRHTAAEVGDEALLLARRAVTVVARDRIEGARILEHLPIDCIILDDGFHNPALHKDLALVVVDGAVGIGNGLCLPVGPLRAPLRAQLRCADAVVVIGRGEGAELLEPVCRAAQVPVHRAELRIEFDPALQERRLLAYCGIGRPDKFFESLVDAGLSVDRQIPFADHQPISESAAARILVLAESLDLVPVTTEKDAVRIRHAPGHAQRTLAARSQVVRAHCRFAEPQALSQKLMSLIG